jgi:hypothetical protein
MAAFSPLQNNTGTLRYTIGVAATAITLPARPGTIRIFNATPANIVYIEIGGAVATVPVANGASGSMPLAGGAGSIPLLLEKGNSTQLSMIASGAATDVYVTLGLGDTVG